MRRGSFQGSRVTWSGQAYDAADAADRKARNLDPDHFCPDGICCGRSQKLGDVVILAEW
jgi:hypothetical protein